MCNFVSTQQCSTFNFNIINLFYQREKIEFLRKKMVFVCKVISKLKKYFWNRLIYQINCVVIFLISAYAYISYYNAFTHILFKRLYFSLKLFSMKLKQFTIFLEKIGKIINLMLCANFCFWNVLKFSLSLMPLR